MKKYKLQNLDCASCASKIEDGVSKLKEVKFVNVNFATATLTVDTADMERVKARIKEIEPDVEITSVEKEKTFATLGELIENKWTIIKAVIGLVLTFSGVIFDEYLHATPFNIAEYLIYGTAYLIVGWNVIAAAVKNIIKGHVFNEHFLMTIATLGAFAIHEMPEAVAVMLFYVVGELFQDIALGRSRKSIRSLLEIKPEYANLKSGSEISRVSPEEVMIGDIIIVKPGEKIPLDGIVLEGESFVDTAALTGESVPRKIKPSDEVLSGMINQSGLLTLRVIKLFAESSISRILEMVENATSKKAETEKFITTFAKYYTPVVVIGALLIALLPPLLVPGATFTDWVYRALVVLVISCPCALVISIPLGYFGGVGRASRRGILVKGSNYLDALTKVRTVVFDKTGTLTKGEFIVSDIIPVRGFVKDQILEFAAYAESNSNHPIAISIMEAYHSKVDTARIMGFEEISGHGIMTLVDGKLIIAGNDKLLHKERIKHPLCNVEGTVVHIAIDRIYAGHIVISDGLKDDAVETIKALRSKNIRTVMLTGDNKFVASAVAAKLKIDEYYSELLPEDKVKHLEMIISEAEGSKVAFVGDGINDAPVLARADVGIAMGALGSDAAIETADVVLMTDSPSKVVDAINVAKLTRNIVWQNIFFAIGVKLVFIILGIWGIATMWEAVFADIGVALIAVFNAIRLLKNR